MLRSVTGGARSETVRGLRRLVRPASSAAPPIPAASRGLTTETARRRHSHRFTITPHKQIFAPLQWTTQFRLYSSLPAHNLVNLPALSPTMENGSIVSWEKKEGDKLNEGDLLCEIETDKATMGFETPEEGYLAKILIPAGTKGVPVGKLLCIIVENQSDVAAFTDFKADVQSAESTRPVAKKEGSVLNIAAMVMEPRSKLELDMWTGRAPQVIKDLLTSQSAQPVLASMSAAAPAAAPAPQPASAAPAAAAAPSPAAASSPAGSRVYASPMARKLAEVQSIRLQGSGSGLYGSLKSGDLAAAAAAGALAPAPAVPAAAPAPAPGQAFVDIPLTSMRATIAKRLTAAKQTIPHYQLAMTVNVDKTLAMRKQLNERLEKEKAGIKVSVNDFIVKAAASACKRVPQVNAHWMDTYIRQFSNVDVSVAVATPNGLITPIVFNADSRGVIDISRSVKELAAKAKDGKLRPEEFIGGTITISNLGMFDITMFNAIINPPQSLIIACGGLQELVVPDKNSPEGWRVSKFVTFTASADHRVVDGAVGAEFMKAFKNNMEDPANIIL